MHTGLAGDLVPKSGFSHGLDLVCMTTASGGDGDFIIFCVSSSTKLHSTIQFLADEQATWRCCLLPTGNMI